MQAYQQVDYKYRIENLFSENFVVRIVKGSNTCSSSEPGRTNLYGLSHY